jgi:ABC-type nitrate/sulfonate/bicarbonate transport system permease component
MRRFALGLLFPILLLAAWWLVGASSPAAHSVISTPPEVVIAFIGSAVNGTLWTDVGVSLLRALGGWAAALVLAAPLGIVMARVATIRRVLGPVLNVLRPISPVAWIPVAILWFGIGYGSKVFIVGIISFFVILANAFHAAASIDPLLLKAVRTFTRSHLRTALYVVLPASLHGVMNGAQFALASAWGGVIIAEYTGANSGVGYEMLHAANLFLPARVMASMVTVAIVGYLLNAAFKGAVNTKVVSKYLT